MVPSNSTGTSQTFFYLFEGDMYFEIMYVKYMSMNSTYFIVNELCIMSSAAPKSNGKITNVHSSRNMGIDPSPTVKSADPAPAYPSALTHVIDESPPQATSSQLACLTFRIHTTFPPTPSKPDTPPTPLRIAAGGSPSIYRTASTCEAQSVH